MRRILSIVLLLTLLMLSSVLAQSVRAEEIPCVIDSRSSPLYQQCRYEGAACRMELKDKKGNTWTVEGTCQTIRGVVGSVAYTVCLCIETKKEGIRLDAGRTKWVLTSGSLIPVTGNQFAFALNSSEPNVALNWFNKHTVFDAEHRPILNFEAIPAPDLSGNLLMEWGNITDPQAIEVRIRSYNYSLKTMEFGVVDFHLTSTNAYATYNSSSGWLTMLDPYADGMTCRRMEMNGGTFSSVATFTGNISDSQMDLLQKSASLVSSEGVGGIYTPVDKLGILAPYFGLVSSILFATVAVAIYVRHFKPRKDKR